MGLGINLTETPYIQLLFSGNYSRMFWYSPLLIVPMFAFECDSVFNNFSAITSSGIDLN